MLGNIVKKVVKKVKAAVPKVVNAAKRKVKKVVKHVAKKVVPRVVKMVPKVVNAAKNKTKKVISKVVKSVPRVVNAAKAKINKAAKATAKKVQKVVKKTAQGVKQKVQKELKEISQKNERIVDKVKAAWQQTASGIKRGTVTIGAMGFNNSNGFKMLDFVLQARRAVVEEYPILDFPGTGQLKDVANIVKTGMEGIAKGSQSAGKFIYDKKIPGVSDFVGALTGVRPENAESNIFTVAGAFTKGVVADGLGGTVEGIVDLAADPAAAIEGVTKILAYPEETLPAICEGAKEFWDKKIVNGSPEDHANLVGQAAFEIASWFVGAGEAKTAANAGKAADKLADTAKVVDKITDAAKAGDKLADTAKVADKITDVAKTADKAADLSKVTSKAKLLDKLPSATALKSAGKNLAKNLDDMANKATKKLGKIADKATQKLDNAAGKATSQLKNLALKKNQLVTKAANKLDDAVMKGSKKLGDTIDQMRHIMNQLTPQPAFAMAGGGSLDDIGSTADKIQDAYNNLKRTMKIDKTGAGSGVRVSGAVKEEVIEDIKSVEEKVSRTLDNVEREVGNALKGESKIINTVKDLTQDQIDALVKYTGDDYVNINNSLRGLETATIENQATIKTIQSTLDNAYLPQDMILYRGTSTEALGNLKNLSPEDLVGEKFIEPGFMSTSMNSSVASDTFCGNMQIKIEASRGARALDISSISEYSTEAEILFNAGQEMLITSAESRNGVLYITVIAE